jgi:hypothetical protein
MKEFFIFLNFSFISVIFGPPLHARAPLKKVTPFTPSLHPSTFSSQNQQNHHFSEKLKKIKILNFLLFSLKIRGRYDLARKYFSKEWHSKEFFCKDFFSKEFFFQGILFPRKFFPGNVISKECHFQGMLFPRNFLKILLAFVSHKNIIFIDSNSFQLICD